MPERHPHDCRSGRSVRLGAALAALALVGLTGAPAPGQTATGRADRLERLVRQDCGACHGMTLKGGLGPDIRATTLAGWSREALVGVILDGVPDTPMPPWRPLISGADATWIANYLLKGGRP